MAASSIGLSTNVVNVGLAGAVTTLVIFIASYVFPKVELSDAVVAAITTVVATIFGYFTGPPKENSNYNR